MCLEEHSRTQLQNLIKDGHVFVDSVAVNKTSMQLENGQLIDIRIPPAEPVELIPEQIPLDVIYEDDDLLVINKSSGMVVHPSHGHTTGTLIHAVLAHVPDIEGVGGFMRPGLVHRLDKDTSGIIVFAKNDRAHRLVQNQFSSRLAKKSYLALVDGNPPTPEGRIEAPIGRDPTNRKKMAVTQPQKGREAFTEYFTINKFTKHSYLDVHLLTGRTHQIRIHMAFIGCPVVGDTLYGYRHPSLSIQRLFLHAARLELNFPGESKPRIFNAPLPVELMNLLSELK